MAVLGPIEIINIYIGMHLKFTNSAALILVMLAIAGCSPAVNHHGRLPDDIDISEIKPNLHNQEDVIRIVGSPSTVAAFDNNTWYYFTSTTETISFFRPDVTEKKLIAIKF